MCTTGFLPCTGASGTAEKTDDRTVRKQKKNRNGPFPMMEGMVLFSMLDIYKKSLQI